MCAILPSLNDEYFKISLKFWKVLTVGPNIWLYQKLVLKTTTSIMKSIDTVYALV